MNEEKNIAIKENALGMLASRLSVDPTELKNTLKKTIIKGKDRPATDEEFMAVLVVANEHKLNPLTKEIYAYPDKGAIVPIVSTDGWNRIMTTHPNYKNHTYSYSDNIVEMKGAKPCPEWIEVNIEKADGTIVTIREYLDECYQESTYASPWKTHTKRMLRHKTKIQGAREAFGFGGIYDKDEADRIMEAKTMNDEDCIDVTPAPQPRQDTTEAKCSAKQVGFIMKLAEQKDCTGDLGGVLAEYGVDVIENLSKSQASELIARLQ